MPTGVYERTRVGCAGRGCTRSVVAHSRTGLCRRCYTRGWKKRNPTRVNAHNRRYNAAKAEVMQKSRAKWDAGHPYDRAERRQVRRSRKAGRFVEKVYKSKVLRRDRGICGVCGSLVDPGNWHLDHVIPLAKGGEHSYANTQVTHPRCNLVKAASA